MTSIGNEAFCDCYNLTSIVIPNSVTSIGNGAFRGCSSLTSVEIPNSVTSIGNEAFSGCSSLTSIVIPNSVTSIGVWAFNGCSNLSQVYINISDWENDNVLYDYFNGKVPDIKYLFNGTVVEDCKIPDGVSYIGKKALYGCKTLLSITIPNSVTSIGETAFSCCSNFDKLYVKWQRPIAIADNIFEKGTKGYILTTLYVPTGRTRIYELSDVWCDFYEIKEYEPVKPGDQFDVDGDGSVNVSDISQLASFILSGESITTEKFDVDGDGSVNVIDISIIADFILNGGE